MRALTAHPAFSMSNPNRVRSLIGTFAQGNPTQFNRPDGAGYEFIADTCSALDPANPQVAARMISAFKSWRVLEPGRRAQPRRRCGASPARRSCRATSATSRSARLPDWTDVCAAFVAEYLVDFRRDLFETVTRDFLLKS